VERPRLSPFGLLLLVLVTLAWGFTWPINKNTILEIPPLTFRAIALLAGGTGVLALARLAGQSLYIAPQHRWPMLALAATNMVGWNVLAIYAIPLLPSGRAALLGYTMPLWSTLLSVWLLGERPTVGRIASLILGMSGVFVLLGADLGGMANAVTGVVLMLGAAVSWALGVVLLKRFALPIPTATLTGWMLLLAGAPIAAGAIVLEHDQWHPVSTSATLGMLYSVFVALMFSSWAWNRVVLMVPVAVSSVSSLATPVVGVLSGMWLLDEALTWREIAAGAFILGAIALALLPAAPRSAEAALRRA
jgi:drug/metabolite transporter (DMT)-like permease